MTMFPVTDCCVMLGIDAKTLRHWLQHAQMPLHTHPTDGRSKCLTTEQLQQLATLHACSLTLPEALAPSQVVQSSPSTALEAPADPAATEVLSRLSHLETYVATLQQHLTHLALDLLQERDLRYERRLQALEALVPQTAAPAASPALAPTPTEATTREEGAPHERRPRSRVLPLIEYGASGRYVVICPTTGELSLVPDSPEWFAWLASVSSFQFIGKRGRFSAHRVFHKGPTRYWQANRVIHQHRYKPYLGVTEHLTIDCLEQTAATLQSYLEAR